MKVKVISVFRDKFTGKYYTPGEVILQQLQSLHREYNTFR